MYAIIRTKGKQFRAEPGRTIRVPSLPVEVGQAITFGEVLVVGDEDGVRVGAPALDGAEVTAEVVAHGRGPKITVFKWKRRKNYRRKQGHRQGYTDVRIGEIRID